MKNKYFIFSLVVVGQGLVAQNANLAVSKVPSENKQAKLAVHTDKGIVHGIHAEKIGYVDTAKATTESKEGQKKRQELEAKRTQLSSQLKKEEDMLIKQMEQFKTKSATMSDIERDAEQKRLIKSERELKAKVEEAELELKMAMQRAMDDISKEIEKAVKEMAVAQNLDVVVDARSGQVLYAKDSVLLTEDLVSELNKNYDVKMAKNNTTKQGQVTV